MAPPLPIDAPERAAVLTKSGLLDPPEERYDKITQQVVDQLGAPLALLSIVDANRQYFKAAVGLTEPWATTRETPLSYSLCKYVVTNGVPLVIPDLATNTLAREAPSIEQSGIVSYLGVPVEVDGVIVGSLCAIDQCRRDWSADDINALAALAASVSAQVAR